jgi:hypothetical protein
MSGKTISYILYFSLLNYGVCWTKPLPGLKVDFGQLQNQIQFANAKPIVR